MGGGIRNNEKKESSESTWGINDQEREGPTGWQDFFNGTTLGGHVIENMCTYQLCGTRCGSTAASDAEAATSMKAVSDSKDIVGAGNLSPGCNDRCFKCNVSVEGGFGGTHSPTLALV